jgi:hypothetical protein
MSASADYLSSGSDFCLSDSISDEAATHPVYDEWSLSHRKAVIEVSGKSGMIHLAFHAL